jgi:hypothetical protein
METPLADCLGGSLIEAVTKPPDHLHFAGSAIRTDLKGHQHNSGDAGLQSFRRVDRLNLGIQGRTRYAHAPTINPVLYDEIRLGAVILKIASGNQELEEISRHTGVSFEPGIGRCLDRNRA